MKNILNHKNKAVLFASICLLGLLMFSQALAVEFQGIGGRPAYPDPSNPKTYSIFIYTLNSGETKEDGVLVINDTHKEKTLMVYTADSSSATGGAFACKQMGEEKKMVGSWIKLKKNEVTLGPIKSEVVPFTITVPQNIEAGEYDGCIAIQEKKPPQEQKGGIRLSTRLVIRVAVTVPGKLVKKLEISDFKISPNPTGGYFLTPYLKNSGNISVDANIKIITRYIFGLKLKEINSTRTIFRGQTGSWNFELKQPMLGGWYRTSLAVSYEGSTGKEELRGPTITFFSWPTRTGWIIDICILLAIVISLFFLWLYRQRKKWIKEDWVDYEVKSGENVKSLSEKFDVDWKLLAKVNKLKPPYALKPGQKIKTPPAK